jgi:hypothetical protein
MLTKFARAEVIELKGSSSQIKTASLSKMGEYEDFRTQDGYLYARIRAISSRVNKNHDAWPSNEIAGDHDLISRVAGMASGGTRYASSNGFTITAKEDGFVIEAKKGAKYGFSVFVGKPIFVDHNNSNPQRARGVIVDSRLHVEPESTDPYYKTADCHESFKPATWVELLLEVDAKTFPKLAQAIIDGAKDNKTGIDGFSMGANVERSVCSHCANVATNPEEFCQHILGKGQMWDFKDPKTGQKTAKRSYEFCEGCQFFEISAVFDPADETALTRQIIAGVMAEGAVVPYPCPQCHGHNFQYSDTAGYGSCADCGYTHQGAAPTPTPGGDGANAPHQLDAPGVANLAPGVPFMDAASGFGTPHQGKTAMEIDPTPYLHHLAPEDVYEHPRYDAYNQGQKDICPRCHEPAVSSVLGNCHSCGYQMPQDTPDVGNSQVDTQGPGAMNHQELGLDQMQPRWGGKLVTAEGVEDLNKEMYTAPTAVQGSPDRPLPWTMNPEMKERVLTAAIRRAAMRPNGAAELTNFLKSAGLDPDTLQVTADENMPQVDMLRAPKPIDTLKSPMVCPNCGTEMDEQKCPVCQWERPAEGFDTPDLDKAHQNVEQRLDGQQPEPIEPGIPQDQSELRDENLPPSQPPPKKYAPTAGVTDRMPRWKIVEAGVLSNTDKPIRAGNKPATNEPVETVIKDQLAPVTSSVRTAADFIAVAGQLTNTGDRMNRTADATAQAPDVAKPKLQVDVTGVGGVDEASNEEASKPSVGEVNVLDKGGVDSDVAAQSHETLPDSSKDGDAGFNTNKTTDDSGPTKTWSGDYGDSLGQQDPITDDVYPASDQGVNKKSYNDGVYPDNDGGLAGGGAQSGNKPIAENFGERVDVLDHTTSPSNNSGPTKTWSGTDGNGVNKQQDPVTPQEQSSWATVVKGSSAHLFAAFKLADAEVKAGLLTDDDQKFNRIAELEQQDPIACKIGMEYVARIKTANLTNAPRQVEAKRIPSFPMASVTKQASTHEAANEYDVELPGEADFATFA